jgi:hypothetical protein
MPPRKQNATGQAPAVHKPCGKVGGVLRTPKSAWDAASVNKTQTYTVSSLVDIKRVTVSGRTEDHFQVMWGGLWEGRDYMTWEPASHLPNHVDMMAPLRDRKRLQEEKEEACMAAKSDAKRASKAQHTRQGAPIC